MKTIILSLTMLMSFSVMANGQLSNLQNKHKECIISTGEKTYAKIQLQCGQKVDYNATNEKIKAACDAVIEKEFSNPTSQAELNLQRDFRSSVYGVSYAILNNMSTQHDLHFKTNIKRDCAILKAIKSTVSEENSAQGIN